MVVWIIGLSGAGKTTLANDIMSKMPESVNNVVLIDGDTIREVFGNDLGHTLMDRKKNADRICQLCKFLSEQNIHVICAILSIFPESRAWNRKHIKDYYEVYIETPFQDLVQRDSKGLYKKALNKQLDNVAGVDLEFIAPDNADLVIQNTETKKQLLSYSSKIIEKVMSS